MFLFLGMSKLEAYDTTSQIYIDTTVRILKSLNAFLQLSLYPNPASSRIALFCRRRILFKFSWDEPPHINNPYLKWDSNKAKYAVLVAKSVLIDLILFIANNDVLSL